MRLIEILIAIAIILILAGTTAGLLTPFRTTETLLGGTDAALQALRGARSEALGGRNGKKYGVHFETDKATVFPGSSFGSAPAASSTVFIFPKGATLGTTSFAGGGTDVFFERITGKTNNFGTLTITVASASSSTKTITILRTGVVYGN